MNPILPTYVIWVNPLDLTSYASPSKHNIRLLTKVAKSVLT